MNSPEQRARNLEAVRRYRARHPERVKAAIKAAYDADPQRSMAKHRLWFEKNKSNPVAQEKARALARRSYAPRREREILAMTGGRPRPAACELCGGGSKICLDHDHESGAFRGWLCHHCNLILGHAKDNPTLLRKLADYLEANRGLR